MKKLLPLIALVCFVFTIHAQEEQPSPILFIYDASGSMWGQLDGKTKKEIASEVLTRTVGNLPEDQNVGLIAYGHRNKSDCNDIEYLVALDNNSKTHVTNAVKAINPTGRTPLARSATMAIESLKKGSTKATIILITDGIESCDGDLCNVITDAKANGIDFKLHIVGFGLKEGEKEQLQCATNAGNGNYYDADNAGGLSEVLTAATMETVDKPDGNFSVFAVKNGKPVDAWLKPKNTVTKKELRGARTYRDTAWVNLPPGTYEIEVKPLENSDIPGTTIVVEMKEGDVKHRDVSFDGGILEVTTTNNGEPWDAVVKMYENNNKVAATTRTYGKSKQMEVPAGKYRITYSALNLKGLDIHVEVEDVEVKANATNAIFHDFKSGIAMIGVKTASGELIDATVNVHEKNSGKNVAGNRTYTSESSNPKQFLLNPGTYEVRVITLGAHKGNNSTFTITVKEGETVEKITTF